MQLCPGCPNSSAESHTKISRSGRKACDEATALANEQRLGAMAKLASVSSYLTVLPKCVRSGDHASSGMFLACLRHCQLCRTLPGAAIRSRAKALHRCWSTGSVKNDRRYTDTRQKRFRKNGACHTHGMSTPSDARSNDMGLDDQGLLQEAAGLGVLLRPRKNQRSPSLAVKRLKRCAVSSPQLLPSAGHDGFRLQVLQKLQPLGLFGLFG